MLHELKRKLFLWLSDLGETNLPPKVNPVIYPRPKLQGTYSGSSGIERPGMINLTIHAASNDGYVLEYTARGDKLNNVSTPLHYVSSKENLGEAIANIITLELLRR